MEEETRNCKYCNKEFTTTNNKKIYCSKNCGAYYVRDHKNELYKFNCKNCNIEFESRDQTKVFCSPNCNRKYYAKNPIKHEYNLICNNCGKPFTKILSDNPNLNDENHYCSQSCVVLHKNKIGIGIKYSCKQCNKEFDQIHKRHFFCTLECKRIYNTVNGPRKIVNCSFCNKEIERPRSLKRDNFFCSIECESNFRIEQANDTRNCETCNKEFYCKKGDKLRFCSYECQAIWQRIYRSGKNHPSYKFDITDEERIKLCETCGNPMIGTPKSFEIQKYCSRKCKFIGQKASLTKPHRDICSILDKNDIDFDIEKPMGRFSLDCFIENTCLAIEVMGTFYHMDIRKYDKVVSEIQENTIDRDKRKKYKAIEKGIFILYLWEYDICKNPFLCEKLIKLFIEKNGDINNFHSMNYNLQDNSLNINQDLLIPYFEII